MRVRIVSYEDINAWILGKFARRLCDELKNLGVQVDIDKQPDSNADINHHIIYLGYDIAKASTADTLMITHIDDIRKLNMLSKQLEVARAGVCMSKSVMTELVAAGLPEEKLLFINPAHDNVIQPRKTVIGITSKVQPDGCKREELVEQLFNHLSPDLFSLSIMGAGWDKIVERIRKSGFLVNYYNEFQYDLYVKLVPTFDYYLYTGQDEGSMGFIDALAAGVKTVVTPQGFHLDAPSGIVHPFNELEELIGIFKRIEEERQVLLKAVEKWTWRDYAVKHLELWNYLLDSRSADQHFRSSYTDGINSMFNTKEVLDKKAARKIRQKMFAGAFRRVFFKAKKLKSKSFVKRKLKELVKGKQK